MLSTLNLQTEFTQPLELSEFYKMVSLTFNGFTHSTLNLTHMSIQNQILIQDQHHFKEQENYGWLKRVLEQDQS